MRRLTHSYTDKRALAVTLAWVAVLFASGATEGLLFLAPALLIAIPLFGGRYLGEELVAKLAAPRPRPRRRSAAPICSPGPAPLVRPRGSRLVAFSLAKRPPPLGLLPQN